jgi:hypothetical protein
VKADHNDRPDPGQDHLGVTTAGDAVGAGEISLLAVIAGLHPIEVGTEMVGRLGWGYPDRIKAELERVLLDPLDDGRHATSILE